MESQEWTTSIVQDGDSCWLVVVGSDVSPSTSTRVHALQRAIETLHPVWLVDTVPRILLTGIGRPATAGLTGKSRGACIHGRQKHRGCPAGPVQDRHVPSLL